MIEDEAHHPTQPSFSKYLNIGGLIMKLSGDSAMFSSEFDAFEICNKNEMSQNLSSPDLEIRVHNTFLSNYEYGRLLLRSTELEIFEREEDYLFLFPRAVHIDSAFLKKDGTCADFFCHPVSDENFVTDLFHAIRFIYLYTAQKHEIFALHSASILYREKIWLFSGPSGTGKSTHTNLWKEIFHTPVINGDLNLIALTGHGAVTHGLPWCGTSQISDTHSYPLGGIILLKQAAEDYIVELSEDEKALMTMQRLISPCWNPAQLQANLDFTQKLSKQVLICRLCCTKNRSAAEVMKEYIDKIEIA
jgi:hypothetical protein